MTGATNNGGEDSSGSVISCETGLAHSGAIVNDKSGSVFVTHLGWVLRELVEWDCHNQLRTWVWSWNQPIQAYIASSSFTQSVAPSLLRLFLFLSKNSLSHFFGLKWVWEEDFKCMTRKILSSLTFCFVFTTNGFSFYLFRIINSVLTFCQYSGSRLMWSGQR